MAKNHFQSRSMPSKPLSALAAIPSQIAAQGLKMSSSPVAPDGNHGEHNIPTDSTPRSTGSERYRLSVDLSPMLTVHLDRIAEVTGQSKSAIICAALLDSLPALIARADGLRSRHHEFVNEKR